MESLFNEMLVKMASTLPTNDLKSLSLVSRQFLPIAQEHIFRHPSVLVSSPLAPSTYVSLPKVNDESLALLLSALVKKPKLAKIVRSLTLHVRPLLHALDYATIIPELTVAQAQMLCIARPKVYQAAFVGMTLRRTENLQELNIEMVVNRTKYREFRKKHDDRRYSYDWAIQELFSPAVAGEPPLQHDLTKIPGFNTLKKLTLNGGYLEFSWLYIPTLTTLHLGHKCTFADVDVPDSLTAPNVHTLELELSARHFFDHGAPKNVFRYLRRFTAVKRLILVICNHVKG